MSCAIQFEYQIDPAQLGDLNVFGDPNSVDNHLTNDIHPIWAYRSWSRNVRAENLGMMLIDDKNRGISITDEERLARCKKLPPHTYERIHPALRLATLLLEKSLPWFWNLLHAPTKASDDGRSTRKELVLDEGDWTQEKEDQIRNALNKLAERYFLLHGVCGWEIDAEGVSSSTKRNLDADIPEDPTKGSKKKRRKKERHLVTGIAKETMEFIGSQEWLELPLALQYRGLFQLALLLVHELAHIVKYYRADYKPREEEPYFRRTEPQREVGYSWEFYMFGELVCMVDGEFDGSRAGRRKGSVSARPEWTHAFQSHVQYLEDWKHPRLHIDDLNDGPDRWLIVSKSIEQFFDLRRWTRWLATPVKHGPMEPAPFAIHISPSLFLVSYQETSTSFHMWYLRRLCEATALYEPTVFSNDSQSSEDDKTAVVAPLTSDGEGSSAKRSSMDWE